tara:strand:- start:7234 stop:7362 length:129 start_codon:yes stop_codon:yes gene_type:complete
MRISILNIQNRLLTEFENLKGKINARTGIVNIIQYGIINLLY